MKLIPKEYIPLKKLIQIEYEFNDEFNDDFD